MDTKITAEEKVVLGEIDSLKDDLVALASKLVSTRSVNPNYASADYQRELGGEGAATAVVADALADSDIALNAVSREQGRENLVGVIDAGDGPSLILNGHVDTVTAGNLDAWQRDPWSGEVAEGRVWGLGAADMKGPIAAGAIACKALSRHRDLLGGKVLLQCVIGEETSEGELGAVAVLEDGYRADAAICMEPTGILTEEGETRLMLAPAAAGTLVMRLSVEGQAVHAASRHEVIRPVSRNRPGVPAWEKGLMICDALARLEDAWGFSKFSPYYEPGKFIINPGVVHSRAKGAESAFFIADAFDAEFVIFYSPHDSAETARNEILSCIEDACRGDEWLSQHPPKVEWLPSIPGTLMAPDHPLLAVTEKAITDLRGSQPEMRGLASGCDGGWLTEAGIPTLVYGPGAIASAHSPNEYVQVDHLLEAAKVYALAALRFCAP